MVDGESVECLARALIEKIRNSNFLEENPPQGESIFNIQVEPAISVQVYSEESVEATQASQESIEDLARNVIFQLRSTGKSIQTDSSESSSFLLPPGNESKQTKMLSADFEDLFGEDCAFEFSTVDGGSQAHFQTISKSLTEQFSNTPPGQGQGPPNPTGPAPSKPSLGDALGFLLGELDRPCTDTLQTATNRGPSAVVLPPTDNEDDGLVEAFRALAPTVDAFLLEISGRLEEAPHVDSPDTSAPAIALSPCPG